MKKILAFKIDGKSHSEIELIEWADAAGDAHMTITQDGDQILFGLDAACDLRIALDEMIAHFEGGRQ